MFDNHVGKHVLITTDCWFYAPDGKSYRAVYGKLRAIKTAENTLGIRPNGRSTNWYLQVGSMTIAGCQIHYVMEAPDPAGMNFRPCEEFSVHEGRHVISDRPSAIYNAGN